MEEFTVGIFDNKVVVSSFFVLLSRRDMGRSMSSFFVLLSRSEDDEELWGTTSFNKQFIYLEVSGRRYSWPEGWPCCARECLLLGFVLPSPEDLPRPPCDTSRSCFPKWLCHRREQEGRTWRLFFRQRSACSDRVFAILFRLLCVEVSDIVLISNFRISFL